MARYLMLWELDRNKIPVDPKERAAGWKTLINLVKQDIKKGIIKDWGSFLGETKGFCIAEGEDLAISMMVQQYSPYAYFQTFPIARVGLVEDMIKTLAG
jgi:hypothetical protein